MPRLGDYRNVIDAIYATPPFRRFIAMMEGEPRDADRLSVIEEWRKQTITRLRETLDPKGRKGDLKAYAENVKWSELNQAKPK